MLSQSAHLPLRSHDNNGDNGDLNVDFNGDGGEVVDGLVAAVCAVGIELFFGGVFKYGDEEVGGYFGEG